MATFSPEQIRAFLTRVGHPIASPGVPAPSEVLLHDLHWAHLQSVPFENLDIARVGRALSLDPAAIYGKIVGERRGGYCFEVNGLLAEVLADVGFGVRRVMARFVEDGGGLSPAFDHLALIVTVPGVSPSAGGRWLVDVGSGRQAFPHPLRLTPDVDQHQPEVDTTYRLSRADGAWMLHTRVGQADCAPWYAFDETPRELADFAGRNAFFQADPTSHFRQGPMATRSRPGGRVTLTGDRLIETTEGVRTERSVSPEEVDALLEMIFGIVLSGAPDRAPYASGDE